ncbi:hypothetical protein F5B20DRAFT_580054 [Whalleya microplaca]|nr:hypothetical protein F5B20DRAFT_580054 [Whalleya microplaca]
MQFKFLTLATAALSVSQVQASLTCDDVVSNVHQVTVVSSSTNTLAGSINIGNFFTVGPQIIANFNQIVTLVQADIVSMKGVNGKNTVFQPKEQLDICEAFRQFVVVHQQLLDTIIGKHSILAATPFTAPIAAVLRTIEAGVDTLAFGIIDLVPTCAPAATKCKNDLDSSLDKATVVYS